MNNRKTLNKIKTGLGTIIFLSICLCVTTFALIFSVIEVENNYYQTGKVKINLNDNQPVIQVHEYLFEPGMNVVKDFFVENTGTADVYYRLYLENVSGGLADILDITILDGDKVLYQGKANELNRSQTIAVDDELKVGERKELDIQFYYPKGIGNDGQNQTLEFNLSADAVQVKNNVNKEFE